MTNILQTKKLEKKLELDHREEKMQLKNGDVFNNLRGVKSKKLNREFERIKI